MGKLLILFITLFSFNIKPALSSWVPLNKGTGSVVQSYIDFENVWRTKDHVYYWSLFDYTEPEYRTGMLSMKTYSRANCLTFKYEILILLTYKEPMARGKSNKDELKEEWAYPQKTSLLASNLQSLCFITNIIK